VTTVTRTTRGGDRGFTLIELLMVVAMLGIVGSAIAAAFTVIVRTTPQTEIRIDDARSTRALATWLSHDTTSAPRFIPEQAQGGIDVTQAATPDNNDCGGAGSNILHLQWTEDGFTDRTFVANYRYVDDGSEGRVVRYTCSRVGAGPFTGTTEQQLTSGLASGDSPVATPVIGAPGEAESIDFRLTALSGETVLVQTGSRNPTEFFP
jgi:prepilin-type N-terminal cleavage/methylation domain-containing protein